MIQYGTTSIILEIEKAKTSAGNFNRFNTALLALKRSKIKGHRVISIVVDKSEDIHEAVTVPHFNHSVNCKGKGNRCKMIKLGVQRYFHIDLVIDNPSKDIFGIYQLNKHSRIDVSGVPVAISPEDQKELKVLEDWGK